MANKNINSDICEWHFGRSMVANSYLKTLFSGILLSNTVYAPPQTGLTSFFINDFIPEAIEDNYLPIYVDLSDESVPMPVAFLIGLERASLGISISNYSFNFFKGIFVARDTSISKRNKYLANPVIRGVEYYKEKKKDYIKLFDDQLKKVLQYKKIIFIIDKIDRVLMDDLNNEFVNYYKELLLGNRDSIKSIYGTSNMDGWAAIFKSNYSPLKSEGAFVHKLPLLGRVFIRDLIKKSNLKITIEEAESCFEMAGYKPGVFILMLSSWKGSAIHSLAEHVHAELMNIKNSKIENIEKDFDKSNLLIDKEL